MGFQPLDDNFKAERCVRFLLAISRKKCKQWLRSGKAEDLGTSNSHGRAVAPIDSSSTVSFDAVTVYSLE
eukprot:1710942-Amphidinium_carterae.1